MFKDPNFVISSDSTCDLYRDYVLANDIRIVPLRYTMEENGALTEGVDDFAEYGEYVDFYRRLRAGGFSRTSMLTYEAHCAHFEKLIAEGAREIIHLSLSSGPLAHGERRRAGRRRRRRQAPRLQNLPRRLLRRDHRPGRARLRGGAHARGGQERGGNGRAAPPHALPLPIRHHRKRLVLPQKRGAASPPSRRLRAPCSRSSPSSPSPKRAS